MGFKKIIVAMLMAVVIAMAFVSCGQSNSNKQAEVVLDSALMLPDFVLATFEDSTEWSSDNLSKEGILLIKYFNPDCNHCQDEAKLYLSKKDSLQNIKTVWVAGDWTPLELVRSFVDEYQLAELNPIVIGKEPENALLVHYGFSGLPFTAIYKDNQLIKEYTGELDWDELMAINNGTYTTKKLPSQNNH